MLRKLVALKKELKGDGFKVVLLDIGAKNNIGKSLNERGCDVTIYPCDTPAEEIIASNPDGIMLSNGPGDPKRVNIRLNRLENYTIQIFQFLQSALDISLWALATGADTKKMKYGHRVVTTLLKTLHQDMYTYLHRTTDIWLTERQ